MKHHHHYHHQNHHHHHNFTIIITSIIVIVLIITSSRKKGTKQLLKDFLAFVFSLCWEKSGYSCITKFVRLNKAFVDAMHVKVNVIIVIYKFKSCFLFDVRLNCLIQQCFKEPPWTNFDPQWGMVGTLRLFLSYIYFHIVNIR